MSSPRIETKYRDFLEYPRWFVDVRRGLVTGTREKRSIYREILQDHIASTYGHDLLNGQDLLSVGEVSFLLSASRGGSSVAVDILRQQAKTAGLKERKILSFPGEQKPHIELSGFTSPLKNGPISDRLDASHAKDASRVPILVEELAAEVGYPLDSTTDLRGFAITVYGRLLLQWSGIDFGVPQEALAKIYQAILLVSQSSDGDLTYINNNSSEENLLNALKQQFPQIDLRLYDVLNNKNGSDNLGISPSYEGFIEEPPFIIPTPWHYATREEVEQGILLMKDPSDAWRIQFWKEVFQGRPMSWLHLSRNAQESVSGLCDGWKFPYGYITTRSPRALDIRGYTDINSPWTQWYANYSMSDHAWSLLLDGNQVDLEQVAATQWADAHRAITDQVGNDPGYYKIASEHDPSKFGFEWFRREPQDAISVICKKLGVRLTNSLIDAARKIGEKRVQATPGTDAKSDRWLSADNHELIMFYTQNQEVAEISAKLGYNQ